MARACAQELAWASYALLRNTNCCGVIMLHGGKVLLARGALGSGVVVPGNSAESLAAMTKVRCAPHHHPSLGSVACDPARSAAA